MPALVVVSICVALLWAGPVARSRGTVDADSRRAVHEHLPVALVLAVPMTDAEVDTVRDQLTRIWRPDGILVELTTRWPPPPSLRLVLTTAPIRVSRARPDLCDLGVIRFINGVPEPELTVSVTAAREFVGRARPEWSSTMRTLIAARVIGRVAAHEIGHYLLADSGHQSQGLMRARFDGAEVLAPHLGPFAPPHRSDLQSGLIRAIASATR